MRGVDAALYRRLLPLVCALPNADLMVNINTLTPEQAPLLAALFLDSLSVEQAQSVLAARPREGWNRISYNFV